MEDVSTGEAGVGAATSASPTRGLAWLLGGVALASASFAGWLLWVWPTETPARNVQLQRLTDFVGMEESPAISPDGKTVAFVARAGSKRQIWLRLLAGGAPRQITSNDVDHEQPRWAPDSSALIYYAPSATPGEQGSIWEIAALGGEPRRLASAQRRRHQPRRPADCALSIRRHARRAGGRRARWLQGGPGQADAPQQHLRVSSLVAG